MSDLRQLYQEVILDHNRHPHNYREITSTCCKAEGYNPLCGDQVTIYIKLDNDIVTDASFQGKGCAISVASASLMTEALKGKHIDEVKKLFQQFHDGLTLNDDSHDLTELGKLAVFEGVKEYPTRIKCATLAWHASIAAIDGDTTPVNTEQDDV